MKLKTINFEKKKGIALYIQLYRKIRQDIILGYIQKGDQLPSIRKCEQQLKMSKTSIEHAYQQLLEEGYIQSIPQKGYFVDVNKESADVRKQMIYQPWDLEKEKIRYDFRSNTMDRDNFDIALWKKYMKLVLDENEISMYGNPQGEKVLRIALQKYAYSIRGVLCDSEQMLIGSSFQTLLYILCGLFDKKSVIGMEETGFAQAETVFEDYRFPVVKLPSTWDGIDMRALYNSDVSILYINSGLQGYSHQPLQKKRREELITWAMDKHAYIIEDDHNGELRYYSKSTPSMQGIDIGKHILYIGSFSKLLLPSLRISYLVFTKDLQEQFYRRLDMYSPTASKIEQLALAHYIADGHMERHVKRLRKRYGNRSTYMHHLLQRYFPEATCTLEEAALQFVLQFPQNYKLDHFLLRAKQQDIMIQKTHTNALVLSFSAIKEEEMEQALQELSMIWKSTNEQ